MNSHSTAGKASNDCGLPRKAELLDSSPVTHEGSLRRDASRFAVTPGGAVPGTLVPVQRADYCWVPQQKGVQRCGVTRTGARFCSSWSGWLQYCVCWGQFYGLTGFILCAFICFLSISKRDLTFHFLCVVAGILSAQITAHGGLLIHPRVCLPLLGPSAVPHAPDTHLAPAPWPWMMVTMVPLEPTVAVRFWCHRQGGQLLLLPNTSQEKWHVLSGFRFSISLLAYHSFSTCLGP